MKTRRRLQPDPFRKLLVPLLLMPLLAACGTLEAGIEGIEGTAAPTQDAPSPVQTVGMPDTRPQANGHGSSPNISADGRYVVFFSAADNLAPGDANNAADISVYDRQTRITELISVTEDGAPANDTSGEPDISADGRWVVFSSIASNLVVGDKNDLLDVFLHDRQTGSTTLVSETVGGGSGNLMSTGPSISADGRWGSFTSYAKGGIQGAPSEVVRFSPEGAWLAFQSTFRSPDSTGDGGEWGQQVWLREQETGTFTLISVAPDGSPGNSISACASLSASGRWIAFQSLADNLVARDSNGYMDIFVYDRETGVSEMVTLGASQ